VVHLFFDCVVAKRAWEMISVVFGIETGRDYDSIAKMWLCNKKNWSLQYVYFSYLLGPLEIEKFTLLPGVAWTGMQALWQMVLPMLRSWRVLVQLKGLDGFDRALAALEKMAYAPEPLPWRSVRSAT
jgi:hypothetical protein